MYRTGQRFGSTHLIDVLHGKETERTQRFGHDRLSVFGIGQDLERDAWQVLIRQLVAEDLLAVDDHGGMALKEGCRALLKGEATLMARQVLREKRTKGPGRKTVVNDQDRELFELLRATRMELATEQGVPAYVVFTDSTLAAMAEQRPLDEDAFAALPGVGQAKLERYADMFLQVVGEYVTTNEDAGDD